jgi:hypothetical protein
MYIKDNILYLIIKKLMSLSYFISILTLLITYLKFTLLYRPVKAKIGAISIFIISKDLFDSIASHLSNFNSYLFALYYFAYLLSHFPQSFIQNPFY